MLFYVFLLFIYPPNMVFLMISGGNSKPHTYIRYLVYFSCLPLWDNAPCFRCNLCENISWTRKKSLYVSEGNARPLLLQKGHLKFTSKRKRSCTICVTPWFSLWTSLGLKFVVQIAQLIDRAFAVSVAGANVKAREITTGESSGYSIKKREPQSDSLFLWTSLGLKFVV